MRKKSIGTDSEKHAGKILINKTIQTEVNMPYVKLQAKSKIFAQTTLVKFSEKIHAKKPLGLPLHHLWRRHQNQKFENEEKM